MVQKYSKNHIPKIIFADQFMLNFGRFGLEKDHRNKEFCCFLSIFDHCAYVMLSIKWQIEFFWVMPKTKIRFDKQSWKVATGFAGVVTHDKGPAKAPVFKSCEEFLWRFPDPWLTANWLLVQGVPTSLVKISNLAKIEFVFV